MYFRNVVSDMCIIIKNHTYHNDQRSIRLVEQVVKIIHTGFRIPAKQQSTLCLLNFQNQFLESL